jgi:hypothetical protein
MSVGNTLGPYRQCSYGAERGWAEKVAGALPIRLVLVSRCADLWVLNGRSGLESTELRRASKAS